MPADPAADWHAARGCPICWTTFTPVGPRHRYCSDRCRKHAHSRRAEPGSTATTQPAQAAQAAALPSPVAIRACPHCGGHVSIVALLATPEAARPAIPDPAVVPLRRA